MGVLFFNQVPSVNQASQQRSRTRTPTLSLSLSREVNKATPSYTFLLSATGCSGLTILHYSRRVSVQGMHLTNTTSST